MSTLLSPGEKPVTRLWETACAIREVDLAGIVRAPALSVAPDGPQHTTLPIGDVLADPDTLRGEFCAAIEDLAGYGRRGGIPDPDLTHAFPGGAHVEMTVEVWRAGYEAPQVCRPNDLVGWCFLSATTPHHEDSGSVAILDPRAGSEGTAMPGLPWGREYAFRPAPGLLTVAPGWLTSTVRPLEDGQTVVVVVAHATT